MKARIHTSLPPNTPGSFGEYRFSQSVSKCDFDIWFQMDTIPRAGEIDAVLVSNNLGMYAVEVKGHSISNIKSYKNGSFVPEPTPGNPNPKEIRPIKQAKNFADAFKTYISLFAKSCIWVQMAVAFPNIAREEWEAKFGKDHFSDRFIFSDDLESSKLTLHLGKLTTDPLSGVVPPSHLIKRDTDIKNAINALNGDMAQIRLTDEEELAHANPQDRLLDRISGYIDFQSGLIEVSGKAGSGKTLVLYKWAEARAEKGERVALITFTKTLATELRRQHLATRRLNELSGSIHIFDIWQLSDIGIEHIANLENVDLGPNVTDKFENLFLSRIRQPLFNIEQFDAIALDEVQDFYDYFFELVVKISKPTTPWMVAFGKNQELYREPSEWPFPAVTNKASIANEKEICRRFFRNARGSAVIALSFEENYPNIEKAIERVKTEISKSDDAIEAEGLFKEKRDSSLIFTRTITDSFWSFEKVLDDFAGRVARSDASDRPLVLVPNSNYFALERIKDYLNRNAIPFINYIEDGQRRELCPENYYRIMTINSARGIEARDVIAFGLDQLGVEEIEKHGNFENSTQNLRFAKQKMYIAISRHKNSLTIPLSPELMDSVPRPYMAHYLDELITYLSKSKLKSS